MLPAHPMGLSNEVREEHWRLARAMDDERLKGLDRFYREDVGCGGTTVDAELHFIVTSASAGSSVRCGCPPVVGASWRRSGNGWCGTACGVQLAGVCLQGSSA